MTQDPETAAAVADRLDALFTEIADNFSTSRRSPILHTPAITSSPTICATSVSAQPPTAD
jgi:hypothetical protein